MTSGKRIYKLTYRLLMQWYKSRLKTRGCWFSADEFIKSNAHIVKTFLPKAKPSDRKQSIKKATRCLAKEGVKKVAEVLYENQLKGGIATVECCSEKSGRSECSTCFTQLRLNAVNSNSINTVPQGTTRISFLSCTYEVWPPIVLRHFCSSKLQQSTLSDVCWCIERLRHLELIACYQSA